MKQLLRNFFVKNNLTKGCLRDLINILPLIKDFDSTVINQLSYSNFFPRNIKNIKSFYFCNCFLSFNSKSSHCDVCNSFPKKFFIAPDFTQKILYLKSKISGIDFKNAHHTIFSDGVSPLLKSKMVLWSIFKTRFNIDNIVLLGIYYGQTKPDLQILFELIIKPYLHDANLFFFVDNDQYNINIDSIVADKSARSMILNMQNFNARCGCVFSLAETKNEYILGQKHIFVPYL